MLQSVRAVGCVVRKGKGRDRVVAPAGCKASRSAGEVGVPPGVGVGRRGCGPALLAPHGLVFEGAVDVGDRGDDSGEQGMLGVEFVSGEVPDRMSVKARLGVQLVAVASDRGVAVGARGDG